LAELADEDGMGRPASGSGSASKELTMFDIQRRKRSKRWGEIPVSSQAELKSIALEEVEEIQSNAFSWIDPTQQKPKIN
jgi:hypothetical protein